MIRIALFEARLSNEISDLVRRSGGEPVCVPAVREQRKPAAAEIAALLDALVAEPAPVFVFSTGVGVAAMFDEARSLGRAEELQRAILRGISVCRGPKPVAALHREGIAASIKAGTPYTTGEFLQALTQVELEGRFTVLLHYGERNEPLVAALKGWGARLHELVLYEWELPEDRTSLARLALELAQSQYAAAAFTSQIQARNLMIVAEHAGCKEALIAALNSNVVVAAVGPTCARVLVELGVTPQIVPESPKMGPMVTALMARLTKDAAP
jgi:uroporphyrinogen-III synthase